MLICVLQAQPTHDSETVFTVDPFGGSLSGESATIIVVLKTKSIALICQPVHLADTFDGASSPRPPYFIWTF